MQWQIQKGEAGFHLVISSWGGAHRSRSCKHSYWQYLGGWGAGAGQFGGKVSCLGVHAWVVIKALAISAYVNHAVVPC